MTQISLWGFRLFFLILGIWFALTIISEDAIISKDAKFVKMRRWMYLSLSSEKVGRAPLPFIYANVLGDRIKENELVRFVVDQKITGILLYDLHKILPGRAKHLALLMNSLRNANVDKIYGVGAVKKDWDAISQFSQIGFDGMITEIEFWSQKENFAEFKNSFEYMKKVAQRSNLSANVYIGWLNNNTVPANTIIDCISSADTIFVHSYARDPVSAFSVSRDRLQRLSEKKVKSDIVPIFSLESSYLSAHNQAFMGDWFLGAKIGQKVIAAELAYMREYKAAKISLNIAGFCYYSYEFAGVVL